MMRDKHDDEFASVKKGDSRDRQIGQRAGDKSSNTNVGSMVNSNISNYWGGGDSLGTQGEEIVGRELVAVERLIRKERSKRWSKSIICIVIALFPPSGYANLLWKGEASLPSVYVENIIGSIEFSFPAVVNESISNIPYPYAILNLIFLLLVILWIFGFFRLSCQKLQSKSENEVRALGTKKEIRYIADVRQLSLRYLRSLGK